MAGNTKAALLDAAKRLVFERGYSGTSVRELAATAGTNIAAVNYHFGSREKLLNQATMELFREWMDRVSERGPADPNVEPLQQLAVRARAWVDQIPAMQPAFVVALETMLQSRRSPELRGQLAEHYAKLRQRAIEEMLATERGSQMPRRYLEVAASYMLAVGDGMQLQALFDPESIPTGEELATFYEGLAAAARAAGPPSPDS
ncbi:MAG TPA: TetR/AcrR family transcriptional regulator [Solirubrobacteraceae bacterium]|nr:TetR/AcrR family transcriptional regulator [Solirubrobacteraceae bacterium]